MQSSLYKPGEKNYMIVPFKINLGALNNFNYLLNKGGLKAIS